jgi:molybdenum cofactor cytidylyltransferase
MTGGTTATKCAVSAVLLAAGASRRFGAANKLLVEIAGEPLIVRVVRRAFASRASEVVVVTGHDRARVEDALAGLGAAFVYNAEHERGLGSSIAAGIEALRPGVAGALVCPADMPSLGPRLIDPLIDAFEANRCGAIVHPTLPDGTQVNPVLWPRRYFTRLSALAGAEGGKPLLADLAAEIVCVPGIVAGAYDDIDTLADLERWRSTTGKG